MTAYYKQIDGNYIVGIGTNGPDIMVAITAEEYESIRDIIHHKPADPDGYCYMLRDADLQWELVELPPDPEPGDEEAGEEDYLQVLDDLGVRL